MQPYCVIVAKNIHQQTYFNMSLTVQIYNLLEASQSMKSHRMKWDFMKYLNQSF